MFIPFGFMRGGALDPDVSDFLSVTGITDSTTINALNTLVADLKGTTTAGGGSFWDALVIIYPFAGTTATSQKYNLKDTTQYTLTFNGSLSHTSDGLDFGGTTSDYAQTGWIPSNNMAYWSGTTGFSVGHYIQDAPVATMCAWGARGGTGGNIRMMHFSFGGSGYYDAPEPLRVANTFLVNSGSLIVNSDNNIGTSQATNYAYWNGNNYGSTTQTLANSKNLGVPDVEILLGKRTDGFPYNGTMSHWWLGETFSVTSPNDIRTIDGIFNDYQTALGRNVY